MLDDGQGADKDDDDFLHAQEHNVMEEQEEDKEDGDFQHVQEHSVMEGEDVDASAWIMVDDDGYNAD